MVPSGVLEPQPANVCSGEGSNQEFHLEWKRRASARQSQMGHTSAPNLSRGVGDHRPKDPIGGLAGQVAGQRPNPGGGTLEGVHQAKSRTYQITHAQERAQHPDINWLFATPKLKRIRHLMWKSIVGSWLNVRPGLTKANPTSSAETLR